MVVFELKVFIMNKKLRVEVFLAGCSTYHCIKEEEKEKVVAWAGLGDINAIDFCVWAKTKTLFALIRRRWNAQTTIISTTTTSTTTKISIKHYRNVNIINNNNNNYELKKDKKKIKRKKIRPVTFGYRSSSVYELCEYESFTKVMECR